MSPHCVFEGQSGPTTAPMSGKLPGQPGKAQHVSCTHCGCWAGCQPMLPQSWLGLFACTGLASSGPWGPLMASQSCLMPATCRQPGSWWPWVAQREHCLAGDTLPRPSCSQLGAGFIILIRKSAGKGGGDGGIGPTGIDKGVAPLPQHSTLLPTYRTFIEDRTGAWVVGTVLSLLEHGGLGRLR